MFTLMTNSTNHYEPFLSQISLVKWFQIQSSILCTSHLVNNGHCTNKNLKINLLDPILYNLGFKSKYFILLVSILTLTQIRKLGKVLSYEKQNEELKYNENHSK